MFKKDTFRLIKRTFNRFSSLLVIVLIGVAFMMGLFASPTIMRVSAGEYANEMNLQDVQLYSSYGFSGDDVRALSKSSVVKDVTGSKQVDVFCDAKDSNNLVTRVIEDNLKINKFTLKEGRLPEKLNECVILFVEFGKSPYAIGDTLTLHLEDDEDLGETLSVTEYEVVGIVKSPAYSSNMMGPSNLNNLDLDLVMYVPSENFLTDYYTTVLLTIEGADEYTAYTDEYEEYIDSQLKRLDTVISVQQEKRKDYVLSVYLEELEKGKIELAAKKAEGQAKLDAAKKQLDEAKEQLDESEEQLSKYTSIINYAYNGYTEKRAELDKRIEENNQKMALIEAVLNTKFEGSIASVNADYVTYKANELLVDKTRDAISYLYLEKQDVEKNLSAGGLSYLEEAALTYRQKTLESELSAATELYYSECEEKEEENKKLDEKYELLGFEGVEDAQNQILAIVAESEAIKLAEDSIGSVDDTVNDAKASYDALLKKLEDGKAEYNEGLKEYNEGLKEFNDAIEKAEIEIAKGEQDIAELPDAAWIVLDRESHYSSAMYKSTCKQMDAICIVMPMLFYLVAGLVCMTTMTRLIDEQRGQIGIYVALGYSKLKISGKYISYAIAATLVGSLLGIFIGVLLFPTVIYNAWKLMYVLPDMHLLFPVKYMVICVSAFVLLSVLVTYFVVRRSVSESAASLLRPKAPKNSKPVFLERIDAIWSRLSFTSKVTARNLLRYKSRFFMTVIGVAGCTALLVVGWGIRDSVREVVDIQFNEINQYDFSVTAEDEDYALSIQEEMINSGKIEDASLYMTYSTKVYFEEDDDTATVQIFDANESDYLMCFRGKDHKTRLHLSNDGVLVSEKFAKNHNISQGDYLIIESANGIKKEVVVDNICEMYVNHYIFMSDTYYTEIFGESVHNTKIAVSAKSEDVLNNVLEDVQGVVNIYNLTDAAAQFNKIIKALDYIIMVIIIAAGSLALVVLVNLTQVNISERLREIATLKVLGFHDKEVNTYIFKEIALLSFIGAVIGLPLGIVEHHFIMNVIGMEMIMFGMIIKPMTFIYAFAVTMTFTAVVLIFTRKPLREVNMIESLKSVE